MHVIGTAGHVDHGKSTLVRALTGIDPDRLAEEKEREMTIDLGFAWFQLEVEGSVEEVGVVDVPGHRDFIENMLAGVGGIDLALFVVAADEGVMPQTVEHLAILDLLDVPGGVVALTKTDIIEDADWLELVILDLSETLAGTILDDAPIIPVSARTGEGIEELRAALGERLRSAQPRSDKNRPRLPIDRVFTLSGFGTIVTGTLVDGSLRTGDAVEIQPAGLQGRIRGLQTHKTGRDVVRPGSRVAVNVSGVDADELNRGDVLAAPGVLRGTLMIDVSYRHLEQATTPLKHNTEVKLFTGAAEVMARARVLGAKAIAPGEEGWLQLALQQPVAMLRGDRFILRRPSPPATLGGGKILDAQPGRRHRRFRPEVMERLRTLAEGSPAELLLQKLRRLEPVQLSELIQQSGMAEETAREAWQQLADAGDVLRLEQHALSRARWQQLVDRARNVLEAYHETHPLRQGMPREELRNRLHLSTSVPTAVFNRFIDLAEEEGIEETGTVVHIAGHEIEFSGAQQKAIEDLMARFEQAGVNSPSVKECREAIGTEVYEALLFLGGLYQLNDDVVYTKDQYQHLVEEIIDFLQTHDAVNAAQIRDLLNTSRKYAIALLEHLDQKRITRRVGDERVLTPQANKVDRV
ncbi:MAG TPA: selenocysteine-specific translation elongation factor [Candidatus Sulfomarinibacteraceae bacterium]|nr:selenocysteine-specific translation elongation factor [Candidatus Sulfomarinibacteraceae bacterium]